MTDKKPKPKAKPEPKPKADPKAEPPARKTAHHIRKVGEDSKGEAVLHAQCVILAPDTRRARVFDIGTNLGGQEALVVFDQAKGEAVLTEKGKAQGWLLKSVSQAELENCPGYRAPA